MERHGALTDPTQVFGFAPYLFAGGSLDVETVEPVNELVQLELIRRPNSPKTSYSSPTTDAIPLVPAIELP